MATPIPTILESLTGLNSYPIPENAINTICIDRDLDTASDYSALIGATQSYELAKADVYFYLSGHPSIVEQEVGINQAIAIKQNFLKLANSIYYKYDDDKYSGKTYGFMGESLNG